VATSQYLARWAEQLGVRPRGDGALIYNPSVLRAARETREGMRMVCVGADCGGRTGDGGYSASRVFYLVALRWGHGFAKRDEIVALTFPACPKARLFATKIILRAGCLFLP